MSITRKALESVTWGRHLTAPIFSGDRREKTDALKRSVSAGRGSRETLGNDRFIYGVTPCADPYVVG
jgi:hypothetical protein